LDAFHEQFRLPEATIDQLKQKQRKSQQGGTAGAQWETGSALGSEDWSAEQSNSQ
jgi:hypothetical protein